MEHTNDLREFSPLEEKCEKRYSIFDYFKEHPSVAIAVFSGFLALGTFVAEVCYTIENNAFFSYWDLPLSNVSAKSFVQGNTVIFTLLQYTFQTFFSTYILSSFDIHISNFSYMVYVMFLIKEQTKECKSAKKRLARLRKKLDTLQITPTNEERLKCDYKEVKDLDEDVERALCRSKSLRKELIEACRDSLSIIFVQIVMPMVLYFFLTWITLSVRSTSIKSIFYASLIYTFIPLILICFGCTRKIRKIKKQAKDDHKNNTESFVKKDFKEYPTQIFFRKSFREMLPNHTIVSLGISLIVVFVVSLFAVSLTTPIAKQISDEYPIVMVDNKFYVVIYETSEKMILEEAIINGSTVVINTKKQWITNKENIHYEIKAFEKVMRLKDCVESELTENNPNSGG